MKTVIIGYGTMGHEIERVLIDRGHTVLFTVDAGEEAKLATERLEQADVAIEFTTPATAFGNVETCLRAVRQDGTNAGRRRKSCAKSWMVRSFGRPISVSV